MLHIEALFDDIYARYYLAIVRYAISKRQSKENAEEIANETFTRLWHRRAECEFESESTLIIWLYRTAGLILQEERRRSSEDVDLAACENYLSDTDVIGAQDEKLQYEHYIKEIEKELSEEERRLFHLIFIEKKPYAACAKELGLNPVTLRSCIFRLRKKLRPYIGKIIKK